MRYKELNPCLTAGKELKRFRDQAGFRKAGVHYQGKEPVRLTKSYLWYPYLYRRLFYTGDYVFCSFASVPCEPEFIIWIVCHVMGNQLLESINRFF